jgi:cell division protein FtsZ
MVEEMEEINRFTEKFVSKDIEVIWGLATDDNLDEEVKITILATGFGVSNIPGMSNATIQLNRTPEKEPEESDEERAQRLEEERQKITQYYGDDNLTAKRIIHSFIMEGDDLFNDDLIDAIDSLPTYQRTKQLLSELEGKRRS